MRCLCWDYMRKTSLFDRQGISSDCFCGSDAFAASHEWEVFCAWIIRIPIKDNHSARIPVWHMFNISSTNVSKVFTFHPRNPTQKWPTIKYILNILGGVLSGWQFLRQQGLTRVLLSVNHLHPTMLKVCCTTQKWEPQTNPCPCH